ncbi:MAG: EAL domain-containing protein [Anaeromicrobium sp.]|jgi:diguanylate cyclase (GGDEF)-like protein/PAS domain S-box-containing protein|uniref:putative bifunctional diguanylate cyclase/phosphodiesterase n=1 Tax=Anaeromicrobium sp. TaxID=1929132 RepID=UPI0025D34C04|nr:EAL domain-containing protein [Anaeromicrobium sp.]MCT4595981.1 EAL domain-containing protein [Anaeromicrobium sp.]
MCLDNIAIDNIEIDNMIYENDLAKTILENTSEGIAIADQDGSVLWVNRAFSHITGYGINEIYGKNPRILKSNKHNETFYEEMWHSIEEKGYWEGEIWNRRKDGEVYPEWLLIKAIKDENNKVDKYVSLFRDLYKKYRSKKDLKYKTYYDPLTGLPNRYLLKDRLDLLMAHAKRNNEKLAIVFLDIDRFKRINDTLGYNVGDKLLQVFSSRLKHIFGVDVTISRQGGDEFILIFEDVKGPKEVINHIKKIFKRLREPFKLKDYEIYVTISAGISIYPSDGDGIDNILRSAEVAMYRVKENGRNNYELYEYNMSNEISQQLKIENYMIKALEKKEFILHYQPQVNTITNRVEGAEALIRWHHDEMGYIGPMQFIPLAEETGFILPLGSWILEEAIKDAKEFQKELGDEFIMAVNISAVQLRDENFVGRVKKLLNKYDLSPKSLELEITETHIMTGPELVLRILEELKVMGVKIAIDDFGTGYSSLSYFKDFPIDKLKIDQSFIRDIIKDKNSQGIVLAMIDMTKRLGLISLAEGVESIKELEYLKKHGCDCIQGYFTGRPMDKKDFIQKIKKCDKR